MSKPGGGSGLGGSMLGGVIGLGEGAAMGRRVVVALGTCWVGASPVKPVAITVIRSSPWSRSSITAPKIMLALGSTTS